jgi:hypothetical protein
VQVNYRELETQADNDVRDAIRTSSRRGRCCAMH